MEPIEQGEDIEDLVIKVKRINSEDKEYDRLRSKITDNKPGNYFNRNGILYYKDRLYVPYLIVVDVLKDVYNQPSSAYPGIRRIIELIKRDYYIPGLRSIIERYLRNY